MVGARKQKGKSDFVSTLKRSFSRRQIDIPHVADIPPSAKKGYLWRLSDRKILAKSDWKRKFFLLYDDKLYYYDTEDGDGGEAGSGVIDLRYFIDCVEAPVTDHKKATNVFILLAKERGFFDQGRYYLSADTLSDMKDWIIRIKSFISNKVLTRQAGTERNPSMRRDTAVTENLYASIKEASIQRSNSMSTIPSQHNHPIGLAPDWHNRSMDLGPVCTVGGVDHNLTYSYSSSEDSLNESLNISFTKNSSKSAESSLQRKELRMSTSSKNIQHPYLRNESLHPSPQVQKMYSINVKHDRLLDPGSNTPRKLFMNSRENTLSRSASSNTSSASLRSSQSQVPIQNLNKMEEIIKNATKQSENLSNMFRHFEAESHTGQVKNGGTEHGNDGFKAIISNLGRTINGFQSSMGFIETEANKLMKDIEFTNAQVAKALAEAEKERLEFEKTRRQVEQVLSQLQAGKKRSNQPQLAEPGYECNTFPRTRVNRAGRDSLAVSGVVSELEEEDEAGYGPGTGPVYAQVRKPLQPRDGKGRDGKKVLKEVDRQY